MTEFITARLAAYQVDADDSIERCRESFLARATWRYGPERIECLADQIIREHLGLPLDPVDAPASAWLDVLVGRCNARLYRRRVETDGSYQQLAREFDLSVDQVKGRIRLAQHRLDLYFARRDREERARHERDD